MATYNGAEFLQEQLDSILPQLTDEDELVISDDGSDDGTWERLQALAAQDARVRVLSGPSIGVRYNFENALRACKGQVIFLCDQDDIWMPDKVQTVLHTFEQTDASVVLHDATVVDAAGREVMPSFFAWRGTRTGFWNNLWKNKYIGCCMAFSRRLLPYIMPFPDTIPMHDQWIGLQGERHGGTALVHRPLTAYRRHDHNASQSSHASFAKMVAWRLGMVAALIGRR